MDWARFSLALSRWVWPMRPLRVSLDAIESHQAEDSPHPFRAAMAQVRPATSEPEARRGLRVR